MGLAEILSNPGIIGLAMAGLSRDPQAPVRTMNVLQGANEMNRQAAQDEEKKLQRADTIALMQALMKNQQSQRSNPLEMLSKIKQYEKIDALPDTVTSFTPDQSTGTAIDYETGQSYSPKETENTNKLAATKAWFESASKTNHPAEAAIEFSKYPNADPNFVIKYLQDHHNMQKEEANALLKLVMERQGEKFKLEKDEKKSELDFNRQKQLKQMEIDAKKDNPDMNPQLVGHTVGGKGVPGGLPVSYRNGKQYIVANGQEIPYDGPIKPKVDQPIFPPINNFIGTDTSGNPIGWNVRGGGVTQSSPAPAGGIQPKTLSEDYKKDLTAINQAEDLVQRLKDNWENIAPKGRADVIGKYVSGKLGSNPPAKLYADQSNAFLGNLSRSLAAERGVLTQQDIERVQNAIAKVGVNPFSVDSKKEGELKWGEIQGIINSARNRMAQRYQMTGANPTGKTESFPQEQKKEESKINTGKPKTWDQLKQKYQQE